MSFSTELLKQRLDCRAADVEAALDAALGKRDKDIDVIFDAVRYSALAGGKRIRPFLVLSVCEMLGGIDAAAMPFAVAIEMIHSYSLIHDDLPCMDDDDLRRGRPTNHKVYGEVTALLAGDALLTHAFGVAAANTEVPAEIRARAVELISRGAGCFGMIGGQVLDMLGEETPHSFEMLLKMHSMKTGALISLSAELGALAAGVTDAETIGAVRTYAENIGLAFQIVDDILDAVGDEATLGKSVRTDEKEGKTTFLSFMTEEKAREYAKDLTERAKSAIADIGGSEILLSLADYLLDRNK